MFLFLERIFTLLLALTTLMGNTLGFSTDSLYKKQDSFRVTSYARAEYIQNPDSLHSEDFDIITDVILFGCADFDSQGNIILQQQLLETALENLRNTIGERDVSITLNLLGPWGEDNTSQVWEEQMKAQGEAHSRAFMSEDFCDNIVAVLEKYDFDGVHFDYEYPTTSQAWLCYNLFLVRLDRKLGEKYTLGVAATEWCLKYSTAAVDAVDSFELMLYDYYDEQGRHSTLETTKELAPKIEMAGIPLRKVNLGLPFYARPTDNSTYWYGYNGYVDSIDEDGYYYDEATGKLFWFNTPEVIGDKTEYAITRGYGGVMIWHYSCDLPSGNAASLLRAVDEAIG